MRTRIIIWLVLLMATLLAGCGSGGGSNETTDQNTPPPVDTNPGGTTNPGNDVPPAACTSDVWTPDPSTVQDEKEFTQTNACNQTRTAKGTNSYWVDRSADAFDTLLFKTLTDQTVDSISPDTTGGILVFGVDFAGKNNKGIVGRFDATSNQLWKASIASPLGNTFKPSSVSTDGNRIVTVFSREPLKNSYVYGIGMDGSPRAMAEVSVGNNLQLATTAFDGNLLITGKVTATSISYLISGSFSGGVPVEKEVAQQPKFIAVDSTGYNVIGGRTYMKYGLDLTTVLVSQFQWTTGTSVEAQSVTVLGGNTYVVGNADGNYAIAQLGYPAFRCGKEIPMGTDIAQIGTDGTNLYVSIGKRFGKVELATGNMATRFPVAIPPNIPWVISGGKAYFMDKATSSVYVLDLAKV